MPSIPDPADGSPLHPTTGQPSSRDREFPPVSREHILNCAYNRWYPKYQSSCLPSRIIPLPADFVAYLGEDGILLADDDDDYGGYDGKLGGGEQGDDGPPRAAAPSPGTQSDDSSDDDDDEDAPPPIPPNQRFPDLHRTIAEAIKELGGSVVPKLTWSAPKDAAWISPHLNTLKCTSPNDVYLLLKSSNFVTHDLDSPFEGCGPALSSATASAASVSHVLVLRPFFAPHPALEFRCFAKQRTLLGACPRDLNFYPFLLGMRSEILRRIDEFFRDTLRLTFPDDNFVFDVYVPVDEDAAGGLGNVCLIDVNPWAPRTDGLLFGWDELLDMYVPNPLLGAVENQVDGTDEDEKEQVASLRLVEKDDPAAYNLSGPQYSAHKMPKDVVDAVAAGQDGMREFLTRWRDLTRGNGDADGD